MNIYEECALTTHFDEGRLMPTKEVVGSFSNEPILRLNLTEYGLGETGEFQKLEELR